MDITVLVTRKQNEADAIAASIATQQAELDARLAVIENLHTLRTQSVFTTDEVTFLFVENGK